VLFSALGLFLSLASAVTWVLARAMFDRSFQNSSEVTMALDLQVLGSVDRIETIVEKEARQKRARLALVTVVCLAALAGAAVFMQVSYEDEIRSLLRDTAKLIR
jgi:hypothetical protein